MTHAEEIDAMTEEYTNWWTSQGIGIEPMDAEETLIAHADTLDKYQRRYLKHFIARWEEMDREHR